MSNPRERIDEILTPPSEKETAKRAHDLPKPSYRKEAAL